MALDDEHRLSVLQHWFSDYINGFSAHLGRNDSQLLSLTRRWLRSAHLLDVFDLINLYGQASVIDEFSAPEDEVNVEFFLVDNGEGH